MGATWCARTPTTNVASAVRMATLRAEYDNLGNQTDSWARRVGPGAATASYKIVRVGYDGVARCPSQSLLGLTAQSRCPFNRGWWFEKVRRVIAETVSVEKMYQLVWLYRQLSAIAGEEYLSSMKLSRFLPIIQNVRVVRIDPIAVVRNGGAVTEGPVSPLAIKGNLHADQSKSRISRRVRGFFRCGPDRYRAAANRRFKSSRAGFASGNRQPQGRRTPSATARLCTASLGTLSH